MKYGILIFLWLLSIALMIQNYVQYPPLDPANELSDRVNNVDGSLWKYALISLAECVVLVFVAHKFSAFSTMFRWMIVLCILAACALALLDAMFAGGVPVIHTGWLAVAFLYFLIFALYLLFGKKNRSNAQS